MKKIQIILLLIVALSALSFNGNAQTFDKLTSQVTTTGSGETSKKSKITRQQMLVGYKGGVSKKYQNQGRKWYVSKSRGSGQLGTKERPAKDLGNIIHHLKPNDTIFIAEGKYYSKGKRGADKITVPVKIYGGFDENFTTRSPWSKHKTIFTGTNEYKKSTNARLLISTQTHLEDNGHPSYGSNIIVDGIIFDNGPRNRYFDENKHAISRKASPQKGENPSPESGGLVINGSKFMDILVQNCVIMNTAPTQGVLDVTVHKGGKAIIENNFLINNTGNSIQLSSGYISREKEFEPVFEVRNNTSLYTWKHDPIASYGGNAIAMDRNLTATLENNLFAYSHMGGVFSKLTDVTMHNNHFYKNKKYDFREIKNEMKIEDALDESEKLNQNSSNNKSVELTINVDKNWQELYNGRKTLSREEVDGSTNVANSGANQLRRILGQNQRGSTVKKDVKVFLPIITVEQAMPAAIKSQADGVGSSELSNYDYYK